MAKQKNPTTKTHVPDGDEALEKIIGFWDRYNKPITYIGGALILIIGVFYGYKKFVVEPKEEKAAEVIIGAESLFDKMATNGFNKDSVSLVLNGGNLNGQKITGLLKVISQYDGSKTANRAKYLVGASYLQIHEYDKAIKYLKEFDPNGADQLESKTNIMLGHAYAEKNNSDEALKFYKKAAEVNPKDEVMVGYALLMAASYAETIGKSQDAITLYKKLKDEYPKNSAVSSGDVDKHLAKLGVFN